MIDDSKVAFEFASPFDSGPDRGVQIVQVRAMNKNCPTESTLSAYYDGELPAETRGDIARHLADCNPCAIFLAELQNVTSLFATSSPSGLSQIAWKRLHSKLDDVLERGLVRYAWEVSGLAAAILLAGSICLARLADPVSTSAVVPPWVSAQASANPVVQEAPTPAAAWYLADARGSNDYGQ